MSLARSSMRDLIKFASNLMIIRCRRAVNPGDACPHDCPCEAPKQALQSQQEPNRSTREVVEMVGFVRKIDDGREADFRLANRRLQPLGHLTAARNLSIRQASSDAGTDLSPLWSLNLSPPARKGWVRKSRRRDIVYIFSKHALLFWYDFDDFGQRSDHCPEDGARQARPSPRGFHRCPD